MARKTGWSPEVAARRSRPRSDSLTALSAFGSWYTGSWRSACAARSTTAWPDCAPAAPARPRPRPIVSRSAAASLRTGGLHDLGHDLAHVVVCLIHDEL